MEVGYAVFQPETGLLENMAIYYLNNKMFFSKQNLP